MKPAGLTPTRAAGSTIAFEVGWLMWLARLTAFAANSNLLINYVSYFWTGASSSIWRPTIIVSIVLALTALNVLGVRQAAIVSNLFTVGKLIPMIIFIAAGLFFLNPHASPRPRSNGSVFAISCCLFMLSLVLKWQPCRPVKSEIPRKISLRTAGGDRCTRCAVHRHSGGLRGTLPELAQSTKTIGRRRRSFSFAGGAVCRCGHFDYRQSEFGTIRIAHPVCDG